MPVRDFDHYGGPQEALVLLDAQERAMRGVGQNHIVEQTVRQKTASIILKIARQKQKLHLPLDAREIADEAVEILMSIRSMGVIA